MASVLTSQDQGRVVLLHFRLHPVVKEAPMSAEDWNRRYGSEDYFFGTEPSPFLVSCASLVRPGMRGLSLADGEGRNGVWLAEQGVDMETLDWSEAGLDKARRLAEARGTQLKTVCADMRTWTWPTATYDVICAMNFHVMPEDRARLFAAMTQSLAPNGLLIFEGIHNSTRDHHDPATLYDEPMLRDLFRNLEIRTITEHDGGNGRRKISLIAVRP